jgi:E3 ubiquitin-protein ligase RNF38/44
MSYEELLALSEKLGSVNRGFTKAEIEGMRTVRVAAYHTDMRTKCCPVCHENFKTGDIAKKLSCIHEYHDGCIDPWLEKDKSCPVCKQEVTLD